MKKQEALNSDYGRLLPSRGSLKASEPNSVCMSVSVFVSVSSVIIADAQPHDNQDSPITDFQILLLRSQRHLRSIQNRLAGRDAGSCRICGQKLGHDPDADTSS